MNDDKGVTTNDADMFTASKLKPYEIAQLLKRNRKLKALLTSARTEAKREVLEDMEGIINYLKTKPFKNMDIDDYLGTLEISIRDLKAEVNNEKES